MSAISEFKITIEDGPKIRVEYKPADGDPEQLPTRDLKLDPVHERTTRFLIKLLREGRLKENWEYEVLGENLFATLFYTEDGNGLNQFGAKLTDAMREARRGDPNDDRLLRITFDFQEDRPYLSTWPWEYLFSPDRKADIESKFFLAQRARMALTRYLALSNVPQANPAKPPLRVLLVAPSSKELPVEPSGVLEALQTLEGDNAIKLKCLPQATDAQSGPQGSVMFAAFKHVLNRWDPHVIHFLGHGKHEMAGDRAVGHLAFTDEAGEGTKWITDQTLANALADYSQSLHLVFLQACESGDSESSSSYQTIAGVAQSVSGRSVPAVVAMHYRVRGQTGNTLSRAFYENLAKTRSVLLALNHAREQVGEDTWSAFGLPVLYLRGTGVIPEPKVAAGTPDRRPQPTPQTRRGNCPWDGEVDLVDGVKCSKCTRVLFCPDRTCGQQRIWRSDKCKGCEQHTYDDADTAPGTRYEEPPATSALSIGQSLGQEAPVVGSQPASAGNGNGSDAAGDVWQ